MKYLICIAAILVLTIELAEAQSKGLPAENGIFSERSGINEQIRIALENLKKQMPCGFPELGIPPLAPFNRTYTEVQYERMLISVLGTFFDLNVVGLDGFDVNDIQLSILTLTAGFDLTFKDIQVKGEHAMHLFLIKILKLTGRGNLDIQLKDLRIKGDVQLGATQEGLFLKKLNIVVLLGSFKSNITGLLGSGLTNRLTNRAIERAVMLILTRHADFVTKEISKLGIPLANEVLSGYTIQDLLEIIKNGQKPVECNPPKY